MSTDKGKCGPCCSVAATGNTATVRDKSKEREAAEVAKREKLLKGELGLDIYKMRERLEKAGLVYVDSVDESK